MKDTKFRGKRIDNGEWVYGYYIYDARDNIHYIADYRFGRYSNYFTLRKWEVHLDTVGQYTGLKDKKKDLTDIYEGDILGENGLVKGNIHETPELLEEGTNIVIAKMGTDEWRDSEQEAIRRGCNYAQ